MDKPDQQIDIDPALSTARVSVPGSANLPHWYPFTGNLDDGDGLGVNDHDDDHGGRQNLPTGMPDGNTDLSFDSVAPFHHNATHAGGGGSGHGGYVLGTDRPD